MSIMYLLHVTLALAIFYHVTAQTDCNASAKQCEAQGAESILNQCYIDRSDVLARAPQTKPCAPMCLKVTRGPNYKCNRYCPGFMDYGKTCPDITPGRQQTTAPSAVVQNVSHTAASSTGTTTAGSTTATTTAASSTVTTTAATTASTTVTTTAAVTVTTTLYDRIPSTDSSVKQRSRPGIIVAVVLSVVVVGLITAVSIICYLKRQRYGRYKHGNSFGAAANGEHVRLNMAAC